MCQTCGKHFSERLWYLEPEKHRIRSDGLLKDIINKNMISLVILGFQLIKKKQPYGAEPLPGISQRLLNWFARTVHGMQALPDLDSAFRTIDLAEEVALVPCLCRKASDPNLPPAWHCIGMNMTAKICYQKPSAYPVRVISKQEAKDITAARRAQGAYQAVGWQWDANVAWVCNCDQYCGAHRAPELDWGLTPSYVAARLVQPEACNGCQECERWCLRQGALTFGKDGRPVIDEAFCRGCGLCIEHCPQEALGFVPREIFYDVMTKTVRDLGKEVARV
jgi:Pyruvate/2-oxoacid:ferredoxin oxidoreductase delta subunit